MRFVIADDSSIPRDILRETVRSLGHEVIGIASDGRQALELCRRLKPDVVILDIIMPFLQGDEVARLCAREKLATHIIIASSASLDSVFVPLRAIGCKLLAKPYRKSQLTAQLESILA